LWWTFVDNGVGDDGTEALANALKTETALTTLNLGGMFIATLVF